VSDRDAERSLSVAFYRARSGSEPVREWLEAMRTKDRLCVAQDLKTVHLGWPVGMPVVRKLEPGLWEVRSHLPDGIARILFTVDGDVMVLLHSFVKKSRRTPGNELQTARRRLADYRRG
jgi:phage-related protein